jgi:AcrR family transcriptional regulator
MAGRKTKYSQSVQDSICDSLRLGVTMRGAAAAAGVGEATFHEWRRKKSAFAEAVTRAIGESEQGLVEQARAGNDPRVAVMLLERRFRSGWSKGEVHNVNSTATITTVSPAVLKAFAQAPEKTRQSRSGAES